MKASSNTNGKNKGNKKDEEACPNCGYCPHCGRSNQHNITFYPYYVPVSYPRPVSPFWQINTTPTVTYGTGTTGAITSTYTVTN